MRREASTPQGEVQGDAARAMTYRFTSGAPAHTYTGQQKRRVFRSAQNPSPDHLTSLSAPFQVHETPPPETSTDLGICLRRMARNASSPPVSELIQAA